MQHLIFEQIFGIMNKKLLLWKVLLLKILSLVRHTLNKICDLIQSNIKTNLNIFITCANQSLNMVKKKERVRREDWRLTNKMNATRLQTFLLRFSLLFSFSICNAKNVIYQSSCTWPRSYQQLHFYLIFPHSTNLHSKTTLTNLTTQKTTDRKLDLSNHLCY